MGGGSKSRQKRAAREEESSQLSMEELKSEGLREPFESELHLPPGVLNVPPFLREVAKKRHEPGKGGILNLETRWQGLLNLATRQRIHQMEKPLDRRAFGQTLAQGALGHLPRDVEASQRAEEVDPRIVGDFRPTGVRFVLVPNYHYLPFQLASQE